jgi:sporulation protein YlmC with PRC-barrel domain
VSDDERRPREVRLHELVGRVVNDRDGVRIGRIRELRAEIRLHEHGNDYEVVEFCIGGSSVTEALVGGRFVSPLLRALGRHAGRRYRVPWDWMDLADVRHPRVTRRRAELSEGKSQGG